MYNKQITNTINLTDTSTVFDYRVAPPAAFLNTTTNIVITATNNSAENISFTDSDEIQITFPSTMVSSQDFSGSTPAQSGYTVNKTVGGDSFSVTVSFNAVTVEPGDALTITFSQVPISATAGDTAVGIVEKMNGQEKNTSLDFTIKAQGLGIIAWLDKLIVGQSEPTQLNWLSSGGIKVVISGFPTGDGTVERPVEHDPPEVQSTTVYVPKSDTVAQRNYTATVYSSSNHVDQIVTLQQNPPIINSYTSTPPATEAIAVNKSVELSWHTQFASSVILTTPTIPNERQNIPANPLTLTPGSDLFSAFRLNYGQLPKQAEYIITANGFKQADVEKLAFTIKPATFLYFKFANKDGTGLTFQTNPSTQVYIAWELNTVSNGSLSTFTLYQPGMIQEVYYLGSGDTTHPQIQYFEAPENSGKFDLTWITANLDSLVLNPGNITIPTADIASGTHTVDSAGTYTLTGTTAAGLSVNSVLEVKAAALKFRENIEA